MVAGSDFRDGFGFVGLLPRAPLSIFFARGYGRSHDNTEICGWAQAQRERLSQPKFWRAQKLGFCGPSVIECPRRARRFRHGLGNWDAGRA